MQEYICQKMQMFYMFFLYKNCPCYKGDYLNVLAHCASSHQYWLALVTACTRELMCNNSFWPPVFFCSVPDLTDLVTFLSTLVFVTLLTQLARQLHTFVQFAFNTFKRSTCPLQTSCRWCIRNVCSKVMPDEHGTGNTNLRPCLIHILLWSSRTEQLILEVGVLLLAGSLGSSKCYFGKSTRMGRLLVR